MPIGRLNYLGLKSLAYPLFCIILFTVNIIEKTLNPSGRIAFMKLPKPKCLPLILAGLLLPVFLICCTDKTSNPSKPETWEVRIERIPNQLQGHFTQVAITMDHIDILPGGFEFLIGYDASALAFTEASLGDRLVQCGWEYFTYRFNWNGNCGEDCPTGLVRIVGLAETNNGPNHPDFDCLARTRIFDVATLTFFVSNDSTLECTTVPIRFYWRECGDNAAATITGDTLAVSRRVYDYDGREINNPADTLPTYLGAPHDDCLRENSLNPKRFIDFYNGAIEIRCSDSIGNRGDINDNGLANEIADAVLYSNYFIYGLSVFEDHVEESTRASDVNMDDRTLTVADLVYLIRIIVGDANPYPKPIPEDPVLITNIDGQISLNTPVDLGAALFIFNMEGVVMPNPILIDPNMDFKYNLDNGQVRILIYNIGSEMIPEGEHHILTVGDNLNLISAEASTYDGFLLNCTW
jgi:hypothetical protein